MTVVWIEPKAEESDPDPLYPIFVHTDPDHHILQQILIYTVILIASIDRYFENTL